MGSRAKCHQSHEPQNGVRPDEGFSQRRQNAAPRPGLDPCLSRAVSPDAQYVLSVGLGIALGLAQIGIQLVRRKPIDTMEWLSLFLVVAAGSATLLTNDLRFVLLKPSVIYAVVGVVMLKPGWLNRYLPDIAKTVVPDIASAVGLAWAGLMFVSAAVNALVALTCSVQTWALVMPIFGIVSKIVVFVAGFAAMRLVGRRRIRAMPSVERDALLASAGQPHRAAPA